jgi:hypothetical protein
MYEDQRASEVGGMVRGDINTYWSRGWCRLEILCALCPKKFSDNSWRPGPVALRMIFHEDPFNTKGQNQYGPALKANDLLDPLQPELVYTCCFKSNGKAHDCDRHHVWHVRRVVAKRYIEYVKSGATAWNITLDLSRLPQWIHQAAAEDGPWEEQPTVCCGLIKKGKKSSKTVNPVDLEASTPSPMIKGNGNPGHTMGYF